MLVQFIKCACKGKLAKEDNTKHQALANAAPSAPTPIANQPKAATSPPNHKNVGSPSPTYGKYAKDDKRSAQRVLVPMEGETNEPTRKSGIGKEDHGELAARDKQDEGRADETTKGVWHNGDCINKGIVEHLAKRTKATTASSPNQNLIRLLNWPPVLWWIGNE